MMLWGVLAATFGFAAVASAAPIVGTLNVNGGATGSVKVTANDIDFQPPLGGGVGALSVVMLADGYFTGMAGASGLISDLNRFAQPVNTNLGWFPLLSGFTINPGIVFYLGYIDGGIYPPCPAPGPPTPVGTNCTPDPGSPFNLRQENGSVTAQFSVRGTVVNLLNGDAGSFEGTFTTQIPADDYDDISNELLPAVIAGRLPNQSWSATFVAIDVPEPGSLGLIGLGLVGVGLIARRRSA